MYYPTYSSQIPSQDLMILGLIISLIFIISTIVSIIVASVLADKKGRSVGGWIVGTLFLGWLAVIILALLSDESPQYPRGHKQPFYTQQKRENSKNRCSNCGAEVKNGVCTFCKKGNTLTLPPKPNPSVKKVTPFRCKECGETINTSICPYCGSKY